MSPAVGGTPEASRWAQVCEVLDALLDAPPSDHARILGERCANDPALRAEVEALLDAGHRADARLESPVLEWAGSLVEDSTETIIDRSAGELIGPWRLIEELGRGGMGTVWLAERADDAFEQHVALKLLKRGLDSDAILGRFLAERQILARLTHPNIAHLIDGGVAADGRPYFAMERVDGEPITRWCDAHLLPVRERLQLFLSVIEAVQYAHRQLVVHRDLKPSNILVTAAGEVKLLDFGIAKLLDAEAARADSATLTQLGFRMLTPEYAAPEQLRGDAVTTATDVYTLGVLLYELLAGQRPFLDGDRHTTLREAETLTRTRPSAHVSEQAAQARATSIERLKRTLRGDLDTIVLRAMHPEPERRYGSAEALRDDLQRYLDGRPVQARPDSAWYRTRKFVARNRLAVAAAALLALTLAGGLLATAWQAREARLRAQEAEQQARRAEEVKDFLINIFEAGGPQEWRGKQPTARDLLDAGARRVDEELTGEPELRAEMLAVIGSLYKDQGQLDRAETLLKRSLDERRRLFGEEHEIYADSLYRWSKLLYQKGDWKNAEKAQTSVLTILRRKQGDGPMTAMVLTSLAHTRLGLGEVDDAIGLLREALDIRRRTQDDKDASFADNLRVLGSLLVDRDQTAEAERLFEESLKIHKELFGADSVRYAQGLTAQAMLFRKQGRLEYAADTFRRSADIYRRARDPINLEDAISHYGTTLCKLGRFEEAERNLRESLDLIKKSGAPNRIGIRSVGLGSCLAAAGKLAEAEAPLREGLSILEKNVEPVTWTAFALRELAKLLIDKGRINDARPLITRACKLFESELGPDNTQSAECLRVKADLEFAAGDHQLGLLLMNRALETLRKIHGHQHPRTAETALDLAGLEVQAGHERQAEAQLREIMPIFDTSHDRPNASTARMLRGVALARLGQLDEGERLLRRALAERRQTYGSTSTKTAEAEIHLGAYLLDSGHPAEGRELLERGRSAFIRQREPQHPVARFAASALDRQ